jgi:Glycosyltransferase family 87
MRRSARVAVLCLSAALCVLWSIAAGKDVNWDQLNYHYYLPYEWLGGRLALDYFAASGQSYLSPAGYVPFYLMLAAGWHSVLVSALLAAAHSLNLALLYFIGWKLFAHRPERERHVLCALAAALGASSAIFWATVGSSFLDPLLAAPMLAGLLLLLEPDPARAARRPLLAGLLFGAAAALKYSNAFFALAAAPLALATPGGWTPRLRAGLAYVAAVAVAVALLAGPWMALMWREFGNPVFPLLNGWFRSSEAPASNMFAGRFAPQDLWAALALPYRLIAPEGRLYAEIIAPDLRFAALVLAAVALPLAAGFGRLARPAALRGADWRLLGFFALALVAWVATSANGRYGILVLLLAGLCLARLVERLLPLAMARVVLATLLVVQVAMCAMVSSAPRWFIADRWSGHWLPFVPAEQALRQPALYLTVETLTMAAVAPLVHPDSSFVNLRGQYTIPPGAPRLQALLARHAGSVRVLGRHLRLREEGRPRQEVVEAYDFTFRRYGYRIDAADCFAIDWRPDDLDTLSAAANWLARQPGSHADALSLGSCALRPAQRDPLDIEAERLVTAAFDRIERACPALFRGQTGLTDSLGKEWMRNYPALDARLETQGDSVILDRYLVLRFFHFGSLSAWQSGQGSVPDVCR